MEKHFGDTLRELREARGMSINMLAMYSEVSSGLISKIENKKRGNPKPETIQKLAKGLKMSYEELMKEAGYLESVPKRIINEQTKNAAIELYTRLPQEEKNLIDEMIKRLSDKRK